MNKQKHKFFIVAVLAVGCIALTACEPEKNNKAKSRVESTDGGKLPEPRPGGTGEGASGFGGTDGAIGIGEDTFLGSWKKNVAASQGTQSGSSGDSGSESRVEHVTITVLAGSNNMGRQDGHGQDAKFTDPFSIAAAPDRTVYVADNYNHLIRKISPDGTVSTLAGGGEKGPGGGSFKNGHGGDARFNYPSGVAVTSDGTVYVADTQNHLIRKISPDGTVSTLAGNNGTPGHKDSNNEKTESSQFNHPHDVAVAPGCTNTSCTIYVADTGNIQSTTASGYIRTITITSTYTSVGTLKNSSVNVLLDRPRGVAVAPDGTIYVAETGLSRVLKIPQNQGRNQNQPLEVEVVAKNSTTQQLSSPIGIAVASDHTIYVASTQNHRIYKISPSPHHAVSTLEIRSRKIRFNRPRGVAVAPDGTMYVTGFRDATHGILKIQKKSQ